MAVAAAMIAATAAAQPAARPTSIAPPDMHWVAPGLANYTDQVLFGDVWKRTDLSPRDRSLVTISALVANGNSAQLTGHLNRALENGVKPTEIGGVITHLAFYSGWPNSVSALATARSVLEARGIRQAEMRTQPAGPTGADGLYIVKKGSPPTSVAPASNFTGTARVFAPFQGSGASRIGGASVHFEAGGRTAWHRHPLGQTLVVTDGCGWVQREGGPIQKICLGDVAVIAPNEKHWHGATSTTPMTHVALSEGGVQWLEKVSNAQYAQGPR